MSTNVVSEVEETPRATPPARPSRGRRLLRSLSPRRISALYVLIALIAMFALWVPDTFLTTTNLKTVLDQQAVTGILALGLVIPLCAGAFDLSIGATMGFAAILAAWLLGIHGAPVGLAVGAALAAGLLVGLLNAILVTFFKIESFIATIAMSSILAAMTAWISGSENIIGLPTSFQNIAINQIFGVQMTVFYLIALALLVWYVLEYTPLGRYLYATGGGKDAARLSGVPTTALIFGSLVICGLIASFAGMLAVAGLGAGTPSLGPPYLIPAFSAVFLGSTQIKPGRFNVWGTVLAVYVLAIGVKGLQLAGAPFWIPELFNGLALLLAVGIAVQERRSLFRPRRRRDRGEETPEAVSPDKPAAAA